MWPSSVDSVQTSSYDAKMSVPMQLSVGATFSSYEDLKRALENYCRMKYALYTIFKSKTVENYNKSAKIPLPERLKYTTIKLACKHYGTVRSRGHGIRPNQKTFKSECPSYVVVNANKSTGVLVVSEFVEDHNHILDEETAKFYPETRRLKEQQQDELQMLNQLNTEINPTTMQDIKSEISDCMIIEELGSQSIGRCEGENSNYTETEKFILELENLMTTEPGSKIFLGYKKSKEDLHILFVQTKSMNSTLTKYPEVLILDTTHYIDNGRVPVVIFMVMDGFGNGRIVAYGFVINVRNDVIKATVEMFKSHIFNSMQKINTCIVDKDYKEILSIYDLLPDVFIQFCVLHVLKTFKLKTALEPLKEKVYKILESLVYCMTEEDYFETYQELCHNSSSEFMSYYNENWHLCTESWSCFKKGILPHLCRSIALESHNRKVKSVLHRKSTVMEAVKGLLTLHRTQLLSTLYQEFEGTTKVAYQLNSNDDHVQEIMKFVTPFTARNIIDQIHLSRNMKDVVVMNDGLSVGKAMQKYDVTLTSCSCPMYKQMLMPCQHIFYYRQQNGVEIFEKNLIKDRWTITYNTSKGTNITNDSKIQEVNIRIHSQHQTKQQKYNHALRFFKNMSELLSTMRDGEFEEKIKFLKEIHKAWETNAKGSVTSDTDPELEDDEMETDDLGPIHPSSFLHIELNEAGSDANPSEESFCDGTSKGSDQFDNDPISDIKNKGNIESAIETSPTAPHFHSPLVQAEVPYLH